MDKITAIGVFDDSAKAAAALQALRAAGFTEEDLGVISRQDESRDGAPEKHVDEPRSTGDTSAAGIGLGAATGGMTGLGMGLALATGLIPGIGPVVAAGTMALLMAGTGAAAGSLLGGLFGMGVPQDEAELLESDLAAGNTLITVNAGKRYPDALGLLQRHGAMQRTVDVGPRS